MGLGILDTSRTSLENILKFKWVFLNLLGFGKASSVQNPNRFVTSTHLLFRSHKLNQLN
jgi:hypothetical protein